jgi:hypothetical protein
MCNLLGAAISFLKARRNAFFTMILKGFKKTGAKLQSGGGHCQARNSDNFVVCRLYWEKWQK